VIERAAWWFATLSIAFCLLVLLDLWLIRLFWPT
jgi:hypothetical protein